MRRHYTLLYYKQKFTDFPTRRIGRITKSTATFTFQVHCKCRMPELPGDKIIQCNECLECFHVGLCIHVPDKVLYKKSLPWYCDSYVFVYTDVFGPTVGIHFAAWVQFFQL